MYSKFSFQSDTGRKTFSDERQTNWFGGKDTTESSFTRSSRDSFRDRDSPLDSESKFKFYLDQSKQRNLDESPLYGRRENEAANNGYGSLGRSYGASNDSNSFLSRDKDRMQERDSLMNRYDTKSDSYLGNGSNSLYNSKQELFKKVSEFSDQKSTPYSSVTSSWDGKFRESSDRGGSMWDSKPKQSADDRGNSSWEAMGRDPSQRQSRFSETASTAPHSFSRFDQPGNNEFGRLDNVSNTDSFRSSSYMSETKREEPKLLDNLTNNLVQSLTSQAQMGSGMGKNLDVGKISNIVAERLVAALGGSENQAKKRPLDLWENQQSVSIFIFLLV